MQLYRTVDRLDSADSLLVSESTIDGEELSVNIEIENNTWPSWTIIRLDKEQALELADVLVRRFANA